VCHGVGERCELVGLKCRVTEPYLKWSFPQVHMWVPSGHCADSANAWVVSSFCCMEGGFDDRSSDGRWFAIRFIRIRTRDVVWFVDRLPLCWIWCGVISPASRLRNMSKVSYGPAIDTPPSLLPDDRSHWMARCKISSQREQLIRCPSRIKCSLWSRWWRW